ncbi:phosphatidylserine decarboxylase [Sphaeroforma arctica JP610]|uniref:Phosphatidylserine decarboxylase n=1 Tax=Sphaeroforma arctica JP610 TaxID=667725 RepID=A0A0L0FF50_9EUKA|nr:phosphatidylserine decarboxylase [Sphaeroforma arctica JP610]KNC74678.1 phosphatidylserine decarboxylase [Sphaeroforma arctica JP610]|eukprot:XP_014148580.1 phosphatidylserine decarboxylase [Sphaeroforma arctica JP610]
MCIARLAPQDYHRWHVPVSGRLGRKVTVDGQLYTVNPIAIRQKVNVFTENLRVCQEIHTKEFGTVVAVCIGATLVGSVNITAEPLSEVRKGDEHGFFAFGGSTVIILFQPNRIKFDRDMMENSKKPLETLVKMGTRLGVATQPADE